MVGQVGKEVRNQSAVKTFLPPGKVISELDDFKSWSNISPLLRLFNSSELIAKSVEDGTSLILIVGIVKY